MKRTLLLAFLSIAAVAAIISNPDEAFQASLQGLTVWWNIVFPGLLPFLVLLELMHAFGAVHALGSLIEPLMRRLFRLPGESGLAIAAGWTGGYTAGAESVAALRRSGAVTKREGQRMLALAHMPSPLFMLLVVGAGFLHRAELGAAIVAAVWLTALLAALAQRMFAKQEQEKLPSAPPIELKKPQPLSVLLRRAAAAMNAEQQRDGRTFGKALGDSVINGVYKLMAVGGFMMFGAVLVKLIEPLLPHYVPSWVLSGLLESHIGAYGAAVAPLIGGLPWNAAAIAAIVSWGGISALLQTGSAIAGTDLSLRQLAVNRLLQAALAFVVTLLLWQPLTKLFARLLATAAPALQQQEENSFFVHAPIIRANDLPGLWTYSPVLLLMFVCSIVLLATFSFGAARLRPRQ